MYYEIEAKVPQALVLTEQSLPSEHIVAEWKNVAEIPQLETEQAELQEARAVAQIFRKYYTEVRILKSNLIGQRQVVV